MTPCLPTLHKKDLKVKTTKPVFISYKILSTYPIINASHSTNLFRCSHSIFPPMAWLLSYPHKPHTLATIPSICSEEGLKLKTSALLSLDGRNSTLNNLSDTKCFVSLPTENYCTAVSSENILFVCLIFCLYSYFNQNLCNNIAMLFTLLFSFTLDGAYATNSQPDPDFHQVVGPTAHHFPGMFLL